MRKRIWGMIIILTVCFNICNMLNVQALTANEFDQKLVSLQTTYYHGMKQSNYEEGSSCFGYAYMIAKSVFGSSAKSWSTSYDINEVKAGDIIQYGNTTGSGHTIFVTCVSGDTIYYTDCNSDLASTIKWNQSISKSSKKIWSYNFSYIKVSPNLVYLPAAPAGMLAVVWGDRVQIQWDYVSNADDYECGLIDVATQKTVLKVKTTSWYHNFYKVPEGNYYAYVCAMNSAGASKHADWIYTSVKWYNVEYNANNGMNTPSKQTKWCDSNLTLSTQKPTRTGYTFKNWNTSANGSGKSYVPGATYSDNANLTLYAQWELAKVYNKSTVSKNNNNYTVKTNIYNTTSCEIIVAGYKNGKLVDLKVNPYSESSSTVLNGDIDKIKVMLWDKLKGMKPISEAEVISVTQ